MNSGPKLTSFAAPEGRSACLGAALRWLNNGPKLTSFAAPEGRSACLGAALRWLIT